MYRGQYKSYKVKDSNQDEVRSIPSDEEDWRLAIDECVPSGVLGESTGDVRLSSFELETLILGRLSGIVAWKLDLHRAAR